MVPGGEDVGEQDVVGLVVGAGGQRQAVEVRVRDPQVLRLAAGGRGRGDAAVRAGPPAGPGGGEGTDTGVDAMGWPVAAGTGEGGESAAVLNQLVHTVRPTGGLGVPARCVRGGPDGATADAGPGTLLVAIDTLVEKGLRLGTGRADVKRYDRQLRDLITEGRARPSFVVSHELPLDEAPDAYQKVDQRVDGYTKVVLRPDAA